MTAKVITFGIQKGGASKTTSAGVTAFLLSREGYRVLAIDMDSQGNLTELLSGVDDIYEFRGQTVLEAMKKQDARPFIHRVTDNLHVMTADDHLATLSVWVHKQYKGDFRTVLRDTIAPVMDDFDFVIIDTPPALGEQTINALAASDIVVAMFESSKFCYNALDRFLETIKHAQNIVNPKLKVAGILRNMVDARRTDAHYLIEKVATDHPGLTFETIIHRRAATGRLSLMRFEDNPELEQAISQYRPFVKELMERV